MDSPCVTLLMTAHEIAHHLRLTMATPVDLDFDESDLVPDLPKYSPELSVVKVDGLVRAARAWRGAPQATPSARTAMLTALPAAAPHRWC